MKPSREQPPLLMNRSMPPGVFIPELAYPDVREAVAWLCGAFGFTERLRIGDHRAQLSFGDGSVIVTGNFVDPSASTPEDSTSLIIPPGAVNHSVMVRLSDVDSHYEQAKLFGARIVSPPSDYPYGERQYSAEDIGGHRWTFSQTLANVDPGSWGGTMTIESA